MNTYVHMVWLLALPAHNYGHHGYIVWRVLPSEDTSVTLMARARHAMIVDLMTAGVTDSDLITWFS
jgi:hypothetical protein